MNIQQIAQILVENNDNFTYSAYNKEIIGEYHLLSFVAQGASGGNCWGDDAQHFSNEIFERIDSADGSLESWLKKSSTDFDLLSYRHAVEKAIEVDNILHSYSNVEYYGNYTDYNVVGIAINDFVNFFFNDEDKEEFRQEFDRLVKASLNQNEIKKLLDDAEGYRKQRRIELIKLDDTKETDKAFIRIQQRISHFDQAIEKAFDGVESLGGKVADREEKKERETQWEQSRKKMKP